MGQPLRVSFGVYHENEFVGWSWGYQDSPEAFYMCNSAIMPAHRRKGLYTKLLTKMVAKINEHGFQRIYSKHNLTNNSVLIPKLKFGFKIILKI